jgi:hypothetical protein
LTFQALVLGLEGADDCVPSHGSRVVINFIVDLDGFQLESKHVAFQECGSCQYNEVGRGRSGPRDSTTKLDYSSSKDFHVLTGLLEEREVLQFVDQSPDGGGTDLL